MKQCSKCKENKPENQFYKSNRIYSWCKECCKELRRKNYYKHIDKELARSKLYLKKHRDVALKHSRNANKKYIHNKIARIKKQANMRLLNAIVSGKIKKRNSCEICHKSPTHCHHDDYNKPFEFIELCTKCHGLLHRHYRRNHINIKYVNKTL